LKAISPYVIIGNSRLLKVISPYVIIGNSRLLLDISPYVFLFYYKLFHLRLFLAILSYFNIWLLVVILLVLLVVIILMAIDAYFISACW
jgi:hypothetical protein